MWTITLGIILCALGTLYFFVKTRYTYFTKQGIPSRNPIFIFGNLKDAALGRRNLGEIITEIYNEYPHYKYVGIYKLLERAVLIRDRELIGTLLIKDFQHFVDNDMSADEEVDYVMAKNLFAMKGHEWKYLKGMLTPMFTSGKLKYIFPLIEECTQKMVKHVKSEITANRGHCIEGKILCTKLTTENVASCVFGLNAQAFDGESDFVKVVHDFADQSYINSIKFFLCFVCPSLQKLLKMKFFKDSVVEYLTIVVRETLKYRKENNIIRNDFLDQISLLKEKFTEYPFTDRDIVAQSGGFFIDGVETSAAVMVYVFYEIARHPKIQSKLREEIISKMGTSKLTYGVINEMTYLDCVINESMRLNAPMMVFFKTCTKSYTLPQVADAEPTQLTLHPGDSIMIPVSAIHMDAKFYPEPEKFIPERFSEENKSSIPKHAFIPYGTGPRVCLGIRYGILQIKVAVIALLTNFEIGINPKMLPHEVHPSAFLKASKRGFWFEFKHLK